jgi:muramoyltetrapeptide carboxypeptidase
LSEGSRPSVAPGSSIEQLILDVLPEGTPVLFDFPAGHELDNRALIFGRKVELTINSQESSIIFKK